MKNYPLSFTFLLCFAVAMIWAVVSCNVNKKVGHYSHTAGDSLVAGASEQVPELERQFIHGLKGITDTLDPDIQKIYRVLDSLGSLSAAQIKKIGEELHTQLYLIKGDVKDPDLTKSLVAMLEKLTGTLKKSTKTLLSDMIQNTLDSLKAPSTQAKLDTIISHVLDENTKLKTQQLVTGALQPTIDTLTVRVDRMIQKNVPFVKKEAYEIIAGIGVVAIAIIAFVWYEKRKYARLVKILTFQINEMQPNEGYDQLTKKIQKHAINEDLEPLLKKTLVNQGIN